MIGGQRSEPSSGKTNAVNVNSIYSVSRELYSLPDVVDSESTADEFDIGKHSKSYDFDNHLMVAVREGLNPPSSLAELADKTETDEQFQAVTASTFSRYTNNRAVVAVVRSLFALLHTRHNCLITCRPAKEIRMAYSRCCCCRRDNPRTQSLSRCA